MLSSLEVVVQRIRSRYDPDRIILFGSRASGSAAEDSDFDLLIVKDTDRGPLERRIEIEHLLSDRYIPLDLYVYTPGELRRLYSEGDPFIEEVVESGKVLYMRKSTRAWLAEAQEEAEMASILFDNRKYRGVCFHSLQYVEKGLKALVIEKGRHPARKRDIVELLNSVKQAGWNIELEMDDAVYLNSVYRGRYPTEEGLLPMGEPAPEDARRALDVAERFMICLRSALK